MKGYLSEIVPPDAEYTSLRQLAVLFPLILASQSPRRQRLLREMGIDFEVSVANVDESFLSSEKAEQVAQRLAALKAVRVSQLKLTHVVIGCDTVVNLDNQIMDKPRDAYDAIRILTTLSDKTHAVTTAVAMARNGVIVAEGAESTKVTFRKVTKVQIKEYVASGEPLDKAGAYGIQGMGGFLVDSIEGRLDTVVGLPRTLLDSLAAGFISHNL